MTNKPQEPIHTGGTGAPTPQPAQPVETKTEGLNPTSSKAAKAFAETQSAKSYEALKDALESQYQFEQEGLTALLAEVGPEAYNWYIHGETK